MSGHVPWMEGGGFIQVVIVIVYTFLRVTHYLQGLVYHIISIFQLKGKVGLEVGPEVGVEAARRTGEYIVIVIYCYSLFIVNWSECRRFSVVALNML